MNGQRVLGIIARMLSRMVSRKVTAGVGPRRGDGGDAGGAAGVREPRRPRPSEPTDVAARPVPREEVGARLPDSRR
jgi:hypothetical protein